MAERSVPDGPPSPAAHGQACACAPRAPARDALTGLPDRRHVVAALGAPAAAAPLLAVLVCDIDQFRKVNHHHGYAGGDELLRACAHRLAQALEPGDTLARQGGNEFIVLRRAIGHPGQAAELAEALLARMREPFALRGRQVFLSASIGIALAPPGAVHALELLHQAQLALGAARQHGAGGYRFHTAELGVRVRERVDLEAALRSALARDELSLQYQPRVRAASGALVGVEALLRWRHPELGLVPPARFIPVAEESGVIEQIDMWVLRTACLRAAAWRAAGLAPVRMSVNLSARQFQRDGLAARVRAVLDETGLEPASVELEITESAVMHDVEAAARSLRALKELGVVLSIDDFGTGHSSLSHLQRFPVDVLKIDRSFVTEVAVKPGDAAIVRAVIALAHGHGMEAVAEGVETGAQLGFLKANGCDEIQGYYFSPPVWPEQLALLLAPAAAAPWAALAGAAG